MVASVASTVDPRPGCFFIEGYENRNVLTCFSIVDRGCAITLLPGDKVRVQIGFDTMLTIESGTPTGNGSTVTRNNPTELTIVAADMAVDTGVYDIDVDIWETATGEYKRVITGVFLVSESVGSQCILSTADMLTALGCSSLTKAQHAMMMQLRKLVESSVKSYLKYNPCIATHVEYYPIQSARYGAGNDYEPFGSIYNRPQNKRLQLKHIPVRSVSELIVDCQGYNDQAPNAFTAANGASTKVQGTDFFIRASGVDNDSNLISKTGLLTAINFGWPTEPGSIKVTYVAGWTPRELRGDGDYHEAGSIKRATISAFVAAFRELIVQGNSFVKGLPGIITSENLGDYSYSVDGTSVALQNFTTNLPVSAMNELNQHLHYGLLGG